jgi:hypothetical protein
VRGSIERDVKMASDGNQVQQLLAPHDVP